MNTLQLAYGEMTASLVPERGGIVSSLTWKGQELLYMDAATLADPGKSVRGGIPILFPICGPDPGQRMPQHGLARQAAWKVLHQDERSAELSLRSTESTREMYESHYELIFRYTLEADRLVLDQRFLNDGGDRMQFQTGLHPYFLVDAGKQIEFDLPVAGGYQDNNEQGRPHHAGKPTRLPLDQTVDYEFAKVTADQASFVDRARKLRITVGYSPEYRRLVVWNLPDKPFVCLEPWTGPRFGLYGGEEILIVDAGQELRTQVWISASASE